MAIYDCFQYFDEDHIVDLRLNILDKYVDYFVIIESCFTHRGEKRKLKFDINKFEKFKGKIIYKIFDKVPEKIYQIHESEKENTKSGKYIINALLRENGQRNYISEGIKDAEDEDIILVSDVDEIPNLSNINIREVKEKIILFKQDMFYYKFNLKLPSLIWTGTKGCKKKNLKTPQWLRNIKDKKYPIYRLDTLFSKTKYIDIKFINNGGWHFSNIKTASEIEHKLKSYLHHREFDINPLSLEEIKNIIKNKQAIYDLKVDKKVNKIGNGSDLEEYPLSKLPPYLQKNKEKYNLWLD